MIALTILILLVILLGLSQALETIVNTRRNAAVNRVLEEK